MQTTLQTKLLFTCIQQVLCPGPQGHSIQVIVNLPLMLLLLLLCAYLTGFKVGQRAACSSDSSLQPLQRTLELLQHILLDL
jgi:hypothetical protein